MTLLLAKLLILKFYSTKHHEHLSPSISFEATVCIQPGLLFEYIWHEVSVEK